MNDNILIYSIIIFLSAVGGGLIPVIRHWSDEFLHLFLSFGAGIFLGMVFLHLLPEALAHTKADLVPLMVLLGFILIFFLERILFIHGDKGYDHGHKIVSIAALTGLSVHSIIEGAGLGIGCADPRLGWLIFISIIAHKIPAAFALTSLFVLGKLSKKLIGILLLLFSLMTPLGTLAIAPVLTSIGEQGIELLTGLTAGTFLYVAIGELLPEVFHTREKRWLKLFLLILGIIVISLLGIIEGEHPGH